MVLDELLLVYDLFCRGFAECGGSLRLHGDHGLPVIVCNDVLIHVVGPSVVVDDHKQETLVGHESRMQEQGLGIT